MIAEDNKVVVRGRGENKYRNPIEVWTYQISMNNYFLQANKT